MWGSGVRKLRVRKSEVWIGGRELLGVRVAFLERPKSFLERTHFGVGLVMKEGQSSRNHLYIRMDGPNSGREVNVRPFRGRN